MNTIDLDLIPVIDHAAMHATHLEEVAMVNELITSLANLDPNTPGETVDEAVQALLTHTKEHFAAEERRMAAARFPAAQVHTAAHTEQLARTEAVVATWLRTHDRSALEAFLTHELPAWVVQHIATMDFVTARFLVATGHG